MESNPRGSTNDAGQIADYDEELEVSSGLIVTPATFPRIDSRPVVPRRTPAPACGGHRFRGIVGVLILRVRRRHGPSSCRVSARTAEHSVLYRVIDEHLETFLDTAAHHADGHRLPKFVEQEFRDFLTCRVLEHGFTRLRCGDCAFERLVPFSCVRNRSGPRGEVCFRSSDERFER